MTAPLTAAKIAKIEANAKLGACGYPTNADDVLALCEMARQAISDRVEIAKFKAVQGSKP